MKKIICLVLAIAMALSLAACSSAPVELTGTLEEISDSIYANATTIEMMMGPATEIDTANIDNASYYLGLSSFDSVERAVFSEPMISSIAYSMCLIKAKEGADIEALKSEILDGVNFRKWLCVAAEKIAVVNCGSTIMMVMATEEMVDDICNAFSTVAQAAGAEASEPLTKAGEVYEDVPADGVVDLEMPVDDSIIVA